MSLGYDSERVNKIAQIMPNFAKVCQPGDKVLMGLEGDPLFPKRFLTNRPEATITSVTERENDHLIGLTYENGETQKVSSMSLASDEVWEYSDATFRNVMERQKAEQFKEPSYKGTSEIEQLRSEMSEMKRRMEEQITNSKNFHNTMIASLNEMASDICRLDSTGANTEFCRVLHNEYSKMTDSRAEGDMEEYQSSGEEDFSADDTDFF